MWLTFLFWLCVGVLILFLGIGFITYYAVNRLNRAEELLMPRSAPRKGDDSDWAAAHAEADTWALQKGFEPYQCMAFYALIDEEAMEIASWKHKDAPCYGLFYHYMGKSWWDFSSCFENEEVLTTSGQRDSLMLPTPEGLYLQAFAHATPDVLYEHHKTALQHLEACKKTRAVYLNKTLRQLILEAMQKQADYVQQGAFWYLNGALWYFYRRLRYHGKPVQKTYRRQLKSAA